MGYLGQKYDKGIVIQRSEEGSAFQENVDVTVDGETEVTPKVGGGIKKVNITSSGGGSPAKNVDLTGCFDSVDFDGQVVELNKQELGIEDITTGDVEEGKVIFSIIANDSYRYFTYISYLSDFSEIAYPWIQYQEDNLPSGVTRVDLLYAPTDNGDTLNSILMIGFDLTNNKLYASWVSEESVLNFEDFNVGFGRKHYFDYYNNSISSEMGSSIELGNGTRLGTDVNAFIDIEGNTANTSMSSVLSTDEANYHTEIQCLAYVDNETGSLKSEIRMYGGELYFNDQPIGGGSVYTMSAGIDIYSRYEDAGTGEDEPAKVRYTVVSDDKWHRGTPIHHNSGSEGEIYEALEEIFGGIINENKNYPDKIILNYNNEMRNPVTEEVHHLYGRFTFKLENVWYDYRRRNFVANYSAVFQNIGNVYLQISAKQGEMGPDDQPTWYYYFVLTTPIDVVSYGVPVFPTDVYQE